MSEHFKNPPPIESLLGDRAVATITVTLAASGVIKVEGQITDERFAYHMLDTARETVRSWHARSKMGQGGAVLVPANETSMAGTPDASRLIGGR